MFDPLIVKLYNEEQVKAVAKALASSGGKIEAIKLVRQMYWLDLEKNTDTGNITLLSAKNFVENGFKIPEYIPQVGDRIQYVNKFFIIKAKHKDELWMYSEAEDRHWTYLWNTYMKENTKKIS